ncbi:hypothetical protein [Erythrobacter aurantius]|nr:hypothetical protein [Erythrobacter aurantius]
MHHLQASPGVVHASVPIRGGWYDAHERAATGAIGQRYSGQA